MLKSLMLAAACFSCLMVTAVIADENPCRVVYQGESGIGKGKHIVWLAGDHEYRGEESLPAMARIMAKHYGFKCTVLFSIDPETGFILPGSSHIEGLDVLKEADLMVVFLRFQDFAEDEMQHIQDYLDTGRPVIGLRTSTHAFKMPADRKFAKHSYNYPGEDFKGGFGRQILGETWAGHYGRNHVTSAAFRLQEDMANHPILRGVKDAWVQSGAYEADPIEGSKVLANSEVLEAMTPDAKPSPDKEQMPAAWVRMYKNKSGKPGRVFNSTHGASEDITNEGFRRMCINACFWCMSLEDSIKPNNNISFVGPYNPVTFSFGGHRQGVKPQDLAGWDSPIMSKDAPVGKRPAKKKK
ncbi:MAG: ThuA domain-containing protein [Pirellulales bacterium]